MKSIDFELLLGYLVSDMEKAWRVITDNSSLFSASLDLTLLAWCATIRGKFTINQERLISAHAINSMSVLSMKSFK